MFCRVLSLFSLIYVAVAPFFASLSPEDRNCAFRVLDSFLLLLRWWTRVHSRLNYYLSISIYGFRVVWSIVAVPLSDLLSVH